MYVRQEVDRGGRRTRRAKRNIADDQGKQALQGLEERRETGENEAEESARSDAEVMQGDDSKGTDGCSLLERDESMQRVELGSSSL